MKTVMYIIVSLTIMIVLVNARNDYTKITCMTKNRNSLLSVIRYVESKKLHILSIDTNKPSIDLEISLEQSANLISDFYNDEGVDCGIYKVRTNSIPSNKKRGRQTKN